MAEPKDDKPKLPLAGLMALLLAAVSSLIIYQGPIKTSRPIDKEAEKSVSVRDRVQSRLWQDPFEAVASHIQKEKASKEEGHGHHDSPGLLEGASTTKETFHFQVMPVFVDGSPYASGVESRLRDRYALVSGLGAAGYLPESGESIRYFEWKLAAGPVSIVPAEWFVPGPRLSTTNQHEQPDAQPILVLWLKEQDLGAKPLQALTSLVSHLNKEMKATPSAYRVLGPRTSGSLSAMLDELKATTTAADVTSVTVSHPRPPALQGATFYSSWATAADPVLLGESAVPQTAKPVEDRFAAAGLTLIRTIGSDDALANELVVELKRRRIDVTAPSKRPHIALISEWDTLYGRSLPRTFVAVAKRLAEEAQALPVQTLATHLHALRDERYPDWVHRYSYLAGLDGELPPKDNGKDAPGAKGKSGDKGAGAEAVEETPVGRSQLDYLRRLVEQLKREEVTSDGEFMAIGVLGSDVYDKLMILQALRKDFPHALFFTTDLDSRLTHPSQLPWTRNLVIASHFGLELDPRLQTPIPPFRDSYQTALFYSVLRAVDTLEAVQGKTVLELSSGAMFSAEVMPRLYEVGRHGAVDLSPDPMPRAGSLPSIHLPRPDVDPATGALRLPSLRTIGLLLSAAGLMFLCALLINSELWWLCRGRRLVGFLAVPALVGVIVVALLGGARLDGTAGEPLTFTEGVSVWPTASLRLLAFVLCVMFFAHSWWRLADNAKWLIRRFRFHRMNDARTTPSSHPFLGIHYWRPEPAGSVQAAVLWQEYCSRGRILARARRIVPQAMAYGGFGVLLMLQFGFPVMPCRGEACFSLNYIILGCSVVAMTLLMFYVVDATRLCRRLIKIMIGATIEWPDRLLAREAAKQSVDQAYVHEWLGIQFIAKRTAVISAMIYYPFVIVFLMAVARHSYFDRWDFPAGLLAIFTLNALYAFGNGVFLRRSAEEAKHEAVRQLKHRLKSLSDEPVGKQTKRRHIERMVELIEHTRDGAFLPFTQHPLFGAIALPTGGTGLVFLLDYLATLF
ncbi:MAG: hypothetical protein ABS70_06695 [Nitrospira sp. SCN 59-13]|nr:MAG: hypothetical protein ABS70_06695 [Nitrospira sp. SCN 59-13]